MSRRRIAAVTAALVLAGSAPMLLPAAATTASAAAAAACSSYPAWVAGQWYEAGAIVRYTDGKAYIAEHANPATTRPSAPGTGSPTPVTTGPGRPSGTSS